MQTHLNLSNQNIKIWTCEICGSTFNTSSNYNKHKKRRKNACISQQRCVELLRDVRSLTSRNQYLEAKNIQLGSELQESKEIIKTFTTRCGLVQTDSSGDNVNIFVQYLNNFNLYDSFESIFKDQEVCYKSVQKFIKFAKQKRNVSGNKKKQIEFKQNYECLNCNKRTPALEVDHIIPLYQGGSNCVDNLQGLCPTCHGEKTMHDFTEFYNNIKQTCRYLYQDNKGF